MYHRLPASLCLIVCATSHSVHAQAQPPADTVARDSLRRDSLQRDSARTKLPAVRVRGTRPLTDEQRLLERAQSLGGRIIPAKSIRGAAPTSRTLGDLMRRTAGAMVQVVTGYGSTTCLLVQRTADMQQRQTCALLVVDEVMSMGDAYVSPTDVEIIVVIPASAAVVRFGERGRYGAVAVYTRVGREMSPGPEDF